MATADGHGLGERGWRPRVAESLGPLTLVCWGAVFLAFYARGDLAVFVAPFFRPLIASAGVALAALGFGLCLLPRRASCCHGGHDHDHGHGHGHSGDGCAAHGHSHDDRLSAGVIVRTVTLFVPLMLLFSVRPEGFSANTVRNRGIMRAPPPTDKPLDVELAVARPMRPDAAPRKVEAEAIFQEPEKERATLGKGGAEDLTVYEVMVLAADPELRGKMANARVRVVGQLVHDAKHVERFDLVRMFIVCCAADARVMGVRVDGRDVSGIEEMSWVQVEGTLEFQQNAPGIPEPFLRAENVEEVEEPDEPFLY